MTRTIAAILALAPCMLHAQVKSPAQPSSTPVLQSALLQPAAFDAIKSTDNTSAPSSSLRVSTGVVAPKLVHQVSLAADQAHNSVLGVASTVVVEMTVDESGKPTDLHILQPVDPVLDAEVLNTISQFRYQPGTLNGRPAAFPVKLHYVMQPGASY